MALLSESLRYERATESTARIPTATVLLDAPAERVIAQGRVLLCVLAMLLAQLASTPAEGAAVVGFSILLAYTSYAVVLALLTRAWHPGRHTQICIHVVDIAVTAFGMTFLPPSVSPVVAFSIFVLLASTLRWNWHGVLGTAAALAFVIGIGAPNLSLDDALAPIVKGLYLGMAGAMLAYVAAYREHGLRRLAMLGDWQGHDLPAQQMPVLSKTIAHAARVVGVPRVLVVWEEDEEPDINVVLWRNGAYEHRSELATEIKCTVHETLSLHVFAVEDTASQVVLLPTGPVRMGAPPIDAEFNEKFAIASFATAPFSGNFCRGRVFLLDRDSWNHKHLQLTKITASRVGMELERQLLQIRAEQAAVVQERHRLFRDLHDGLLQSLAAAGFQIKLLTESPADGIASRLGTLKELLAKEQNRIRVAIEEDRQLPAGEELALNGHSHELLSQAARQWNCATSIKVTPVDAKLPRGLFDELPFIFNEAVANAVRHGRASRVDVSIHRADQQLIVSIRDNGLGFARASAAVQRSGSVIPATKPGSICERVGKLGGSVLVHGTESGTELTITMSVP